MGDVVQLQFRSDGWPVPTNRDVRAIKTHPVALLEQLESELVDLKEICPKQVVSRVEFALLKVDALQEAVANYDELVRENERLEGENETLTSEVDELRDGKANHDEEVSDEA